MFFIVVGVPNSKIIQKQKYHTLKKCHTMGKPSTHIVYSKQYQKEALAYRNYLLLLGYTKDTCQSRYLFLKEFFSWLESHKIYKLTSITKSTINAYYHYIRTRKSIRTGKVLQAKGVYDIMRCIQSYFGYILDLGKLEINPSSHLKLVSTGNVVVRKVFTEQEIKELYQAVINLQEKIMLHMGYGCGLRVHEMSQLNILDIRLNERLVVVQKGKNNKRRLIPITSSVCSDLEFFISTERKTNDSCSALFLNSKGRRMQEWTFNSILKQLLKRSNFGKVLSLSVVKKIGTHTLRHSIATHLLNRGMKLEDIQKFLGHSYIESTTIYTHISQDQLKSL